MANPNTAVFPGAIPGDSTLMVATNGAWATLTADMDGSQTTMSVSSAFNYPCIVLVESEVIYVGTEAGLNYGSLTRGFLSSTASTHLNGTPIYGYVMAYHHNQIVAEIKAIATALGINLGNMVQSGQTAGGDLTGTYPNPSVNQFDGNTGSQVSNAVANSHSQNTDLGTTSTSYYIGTSAGASIRMGTGSPNTVVGGNPGDIYLNLSGGSATTLWVKESGSGTNTGWVGK